MKNEERMKVGIMQPYFMPYLGYWQLINAVDNFVVYDNIKYTKKGWFNRNNFLQNKKATLFSIPLKKDSDSLFVCERLVSPDFQRIKLLSQINNAYGKSPFYSEVLPLLEAIILFESDNLFEYIYNSISLIVDYLDIETEIVVSSTIAIDHSLKSQQKVLAFCEALGADTYVNSMGGRELYSCDVFKSKGIDLRFIRMGNVEYNQNINEFVPFLSIMDVMMFNSKDKVISFLNNYIFEK